MNQKTNVHQSAEIKQVFDKTVPRSLPSRYYVDRQFFLEERKILFENCWVAAAFSHDLDNPGDYMPVKIAGVNILFVRNKEHQIKAFHNVCSHRGMTLASGKGTSSGLLSCPYHAWSYDFNGTLKATPHIGGTDVHKLDGFDKSCHGLKAIACQQWMGVIFVHLALDGHNEKNVKENFDRWIQPLRSRWALFENQPLHYHLDDSSFILEPNCNWKLAVENYCESYHLPWVHPELNRFSKLEDHYEILLERDFSGQGSLKYSAPVSLPIIPDLPDFWTCRGEYMSVYPNLLLGVHKDFFVANILTPLSESKTREEVRLFYFSQNSAPKARVDTQRIWHTIFSEDVAPVEGMHEGRLSPAYDGGIFSKVMEQPTWHFNCWVANFYQ